MALVLINTWANATIKKVAPCPPLPLPQQSHQKWPSSFSALDSSQKGEQQVIGSPLTTFDIRNQIRNDLLLVSARVFAIFSEKEGKQAGIQIKNNIKHLL